MTTQNQDEILRLFQEFRSKSNLSQLADPINIGFTAPPEGSIVSFEQAKDLETRGLLFDQETGRHLFNIPREFFQPLSQESIDFRRQTEGSLFQQAVSGAVGGVIGAAQAVERNVLDPLTRGSERLIQAVTGLSPETQQQANEQILAANEALVEKIPEPIREAGSAVQEVLEQPGAADVILPGVGLAAGGIKFVGKADTAASVINAASRRGVPGLGIGNTFNVHPGPNGVPIELTPNLTGIQQSLDITFDMDNLRKLGTVMGDIPIVKKAIELADPSLVARDPLGQLAIIQSRLWDDAVTKSDIAMMHPNEIGTMRDLFGPTDLNTGLLTKGKLAGLSVNEVAESPGKFTHLLNPEQTDWIRRIGDVEESVFFLAKRNGIEVGKLSEDALAEVERYAGRIVMGKIDDAGEVVQFQFIGGGASRLGGKTSQEKLRLIDDISKAQKDGWIYMPYEDAVNAKLRSMYRRVANKSIENHILKNLPEGVKIRGPLDAFPEVRAADDVIRQSLGERDALVSAKQLANRAIRGEKLLPQSIDAIERFQPDLARQLNEALSISIPDAERIITALGKDVRKGTVITRDAFRQALFDIRNERLGKGLPSPGGVVPTGIGRRGPRRLGDDITPGELSAVVRRLGRDQRSTERFIESIYKEQLGAIRKIRGSKFRQIIKQANAVLDEANRGLTVAKNARKPIVAKIKASDVTIQPFGATPFRGKAVRQFNEDITKFFGNAEANQQASAFFRGLNLLSAPSRVFQLAGDFSMFMIQLQAAIIRHPIAAFKSADDMLQVFARALVNPKAARRFRAREISKNRDLLQKYPNYIMAGQNEFTEALRAKGLLANVNPLDPGLTKGTRIRGVFGTVAAPLRPFVQSFEATMDKAGIEMLKSMDSWVHTPRDIAAVSDYVNSMRGIASSKKLGVPATQRFTEAALLLAPRYRRGVFTLWSNLFQNGLRGKMARQAMISYFAGIHFTAAGITLGLGISQGKSPREIEKDLKDVLNPLSPRYMAWRIGGQLVGPGGKLLSDYRLFAKVGASVATVGGVYDAPPTQDFTELDEFRDNPGVRWARGQLAAGPSTLADVLEGKDYLGDPIGRGGLDNFTDPSNWADVGERVGENFVPLWLKSVLFEGGDTTGRAVRGVAEIGGLRAFPESPSAQLRNVREDHMRRRGIDPLDNEFFQLDRRIQDEINAESDTLVAIERRAAQRRKRLDRYQKYLDLRDAEDAKFADTTTAAFTEFGGVINPDGSFDFDTLQGKQFRARMAQLGRDRSLELQRLRNTPEEAGGFSEDLAFFDELDPPTNRFNIALDKYRNSLFDESLTDEVTGEYDFEERDERLAGLEADPEVGPQMLEDIQTYLTERLPDIRKQYRLDQEVLRDYWNITRSLVKLNDLEDQWEEYKSIPTPDERLFFLIRQDSDGTFPNILLKGVLDLSAIRQQVIEASDVTISRALFRWKYKSAPLNPDVRIPSLQRAAERQGFGQ